MRAVSSLPPSRARSQVACSELDRDRKSTSATHAAWPPHPPGSQWSVGLGTASRSLRRRKEAAASAEPGSRAVVCLDAAAAAVPSVPIHINCSSDNHARSLNVAGRCARSACKTSFRVQNFRSPAPFRPQIERAEQTCESGFRRRGLGDRSAVHLGDAGGDATSRPAPGCRCCRLRYRGIAC